MFFYEDEADTKTKQFTNNMSSGSDPAEHDYDLNLITELFPSEPEQFVRISKDHNADAASYRDARQSDSESFGHEKAIKEMEDMAEDFMLLSPTAQGGPRAKTALFSRMNK